MLSTLNKLSITFETLYIFTVNVVGIDVCLDIRRFLTFGNNVIVVTFVCKITNLNLFFVIY